MLDEAECFHPRCNPMPFRHVRPVVGVSGNYSALIVARETPHMGRSMPRKIHAPGVVADVATQYLPPKGLTRLGRVQARGETGHEREDNFLLVLRVMVNVVEQ